MSHNSNDNTDAKAFFKQYGAEIAEALREQEEDGSGTRRPVNVEESMLELYRSLCFDEPYVDTSSNFPIIVSALSRQLLSSTSSYALSDRFVNGVLYLSSQTKTHANSKTTEKEPLSKNNGASNNNNSKESSIAIAKLAFCVLIQVPLQICEKMNDIKTVRKYLGSYKGSLSIITESSNKEFGSSIADTTAKVSEAAIDEVVNKIANGMNALTMDGKEEEDDSNSLSKEVLAAESDPSDYDYGEGVVSEDLHQPFQFSLEEENWLDPVNLFKPDPTLSTEQAQFAVGSLLKHATYSLLEPLLFALNKKEIESHTSNLSKLIFLLLKPQSPLLRNNDSGDDDNMDAAAGALQDATMSPFWVLRDAAVYSMTSTKHKQLSLASTYLDVLHKLIAVDQEHLQDLGGIGAASQKTTDLSAASIVGLSALSSWCGMTETISTPSAISAVLDAMNDISHVVERASNQYNRNKLLHDLIPMLQLMSGISIDNVKTDRMSNSKIPQTLLNSGLLRQLLVIGLSNTDLSAAPFFHHALWGLSVAHPTTIGKYVARYPSTKDLVRHYTVKTNGDSSPRHCVACILWNGFGWMQTDTAADHKAPRVVWKKKTAAQHQQKAATSPPLSQDECLEVCQKSWSLLCQSIESCIQNSAKDPETASDILDEWERLFAFVSFPSVTTTFLKLLEESNLQPISKCLSTILLQKFEKKKEHEEASSSELEKNADDDPEGKLKKPKSTHHLILSRTRKIIKQYTLFFQGKAGSSKTD